MATDNFNRANEDPLSGGGNWGALGTLDQLEIVSNEVVGTTAGECASRYLTTFGPDTQMAVRYTAAVGNISFLMWLGLADGNLDTWDGYQLSVTDSESRTIAIGVYVDGALVDVEFTEDTFPPIVEGDVISFSRLGDVLSAAINGTTELEWQDSTFSEAGQVAIGMFSASDALDDFSATTANVGGYVLLGV